MILSSTLSKRVLKPRPSRRTTRHAAHDDPTIDTDINAGVEIEVQSSRSHIRLLAAVALLCLIAPISAQLPWLASGFIWLWTGACLLHLYHSQSSLIALHDNGDAWQLEYCDRCLDAHYENAQWCNAYLILLTFKDDSGKTHHISVWRDSVTDSGFSWLAARVTLTSPDKKVKTVAPSSVDRFTHSR